MYVLDERFQQFATERQWEVLKALAETGSIRKAAKALKCHLSLVSQVLRAVKKKAAQQGFAPEYGLIHQVPDGLALRGTSILYDRDGNVKGYWNKTKTAGRPDEETVHVPDPKIITKVSTLYDHQGQVAQQWVAEKPDDKAREKLWQECAEAFASKLPKVAKVPAIRSGSSELMACYPVGDHHLGMLSWEEETGANYDLSIGEKLLSGATDHLVSVAPSCNQAAVVFLGDFMHYDSFKTVTPTSGNLLDADSRFPKMVRAAIRSMRYLIEAAAKKHKELSVIVEIGNHDLASSIFLMECLSNIYANNPRIKIDTSPMHYHYLRFGKNLVMTHHGHGVKMDRLPLIMATDRHEDWGQTKFRYIWTGHIHHRKSSSVVDQAQDFNGASVESFRVLAPADAWAAQKGYRPVRDMKGIILHREFGEVARHTVNPDMLA